MDISTSQAYKRILLKLQKIKDLLLSAKFLHVILIKKIT
jgi:hypothetical protein